MHAYVNMPGRNDLITALTDSLFARKESNRCNYIHEGRKKSPQTGMTALVKGSVA